MTPTACRPDPRSASVVDLAARRRTGEQSVSRAAAAPALHITPEFLAALNCRGEWAPERRHLRAI